MNEGGCSLLSKYIFIPCWLRVRPSYSLLQRVDSLYLGEKELAFQLVTNLKAKALQLSSIPSRRVQQDRKAAVNDVNHVLQTVGCSCIVPGRQSAWEQTNESVKDSRTGDLAKRVNAANICVWII